MSELVETIDSPSLFLYADCAYLIGLERERSRGIIVIFSVIEFVKGKERPMSNDVMWIPSYL